MTDLLENRIPQLLARVDLGELVTRLGGIETNRGTYHRPNPSHEDRNPSFTVKDSRWKCWSVCAAAGDAIDLLVWLKGCTKAEAIDELAALVGHERPGVPGYSGTAGSRSRLVEWCARRGWGPRVKPGELRHLHPNWGWKRYASTDRASRSDGEGIMVHPTGYEPMLATTSGQLEGEGWAFEPKLDGWRAGVHIHAGGVAVYSRPGRDVTEDVPQLAALVGVVPEGTVLDGELVAGSGRASSFYQLCPQLSTERAAVTFAAFDLLAVGGRSVIYEPYQARRRALSDLCFLGPAWCTLHAWIDVEVADLLAACELQGVEGVVAKRLRSRYRPGRRSPDWVKIKTDTWRTTHAPLRMARR